MPGAVDLPDVNLWLALAVGDHVHHDRARRYWFDESAEQVAFCRVTVLGLLRLTTNATVMGGKPLTAAEAWSTYRAFRQLDEVFLATGEDGCEDVLGWWVMGSTVIPRLWTDAYLGALAKASGWRLVSFDGDFTRFDGLELLLLDR